MARGFVYVLSNESMQGIYKIGFTTKHPRDRMDELSRATACPTAFELMAFIGCGDAHWTEGEIHKNLSAYRINASREFFRVSAEIIQDQLRQYGDPQTDAFFDSPLDWQIDMEYWRANKKWPVQYFFSQCADPIDWVKSGGLD